MKKKFPILLIASALLFAGCEKKAQEQVPGSQSEPSGEVQPTTVAVTGVSLNKAAATLQIGKSLILTPTVAPSNATNQKVTWTSDDTSVATVKNGVVSGKNEGVATITVTTVDGAFTDECTIIVSESGSSTGGDPIVDPDTGEIIDLDGFEEIAETPEGVILEDWTDDMKAILSKHLGGYVPPFFWMPELRVTYDNLGILQVRGAADDETILTIFAMVLDQHPEVQYYVGKDNADRTHVYGRIFGDITLISFDALYGNGYLTINYDMDVASYTWPAEGIAELIKEEYESRQTVLPQYEYENARYIIESDIMSNLYIYCMGAPETSPAEYKTLLESYRWSVVEGTGDEAGYYYATSRDRKVIAVFYYDGTGLMIETTHGEGESYTTWEDCLWAIDDFGQYELRRTDNLSDLIPEIPTAELYEITRDVRGGLAIQAYKHTDFKQADIFNYCNAAQLSSEGKLLFTMKGDDFWLLDNVDHNFAIRFYLEDYVDDTLAVSTLCMVIYDYKIYEGAYVYYGTWPEAQVNTLKNNIGGTISIPSYADEDATYYVFFDYGTTMKIEVCYTKSDALSTYRTALEDKFYTVTSITGGFEAIDRNERIKITGTFEGTTLTINLEKYIKDTSTDTKAKFDFKDMSQLSMSGDKATGTWTNGKVSFVVTKNTSNYDVGGGFSGQEAKGFLFNPLRIYNKQKVKISVSSGTITRLAFELTNVNGDTGKTVDGFSVTAMNTMSVTGATFKSFDTDCSIAVFDVNANTSSVEFVVNVDSDSKHGVMFLSLDVTMAV